VAMILAIFADKTLKHGPLEALITTDEETSMDGVKKFNVDLIKSKYMINLDSENDSEVCIGCPGSIDIEAILPFQRDNIYRSNSTNLHISLSGGLGGHSGGVIGEKRINAIKEIFDILNFINQKFDIRLVNIDKSGIVKNVIPFECGATINALTSDIDAIKDIVNEEYKQLKVEYDQEKKIKIACEILSSKEMPIIKPDTCKIIGIFCAVPNGV
jgi:dipeptidase D